MESSRWRASSQSVGMSAVNYPAKQADDIEYCRSERHRYCMYMDKTYGAVPNKRTRGTKR